MFAGRISLVTGAGSGIGKSIAKVLALEGANVIVTDINEAAAQSTLKILENQENHLCLPIDVRKTDSVAKAFETAVKHFSHPPVLLAQAAGIAMNHSLRAMTEEQFSDVLDVNIKGTFLVQKEFCKHLESLDKFEGASIVNFGSIMGKHGFPRFSCYAATKAAIEAFTTSTAKELGKKNIRVNCIRPGLIDTPMTNHAEEKDRQMTIMMTPLQRIGQPEDIADVAAFLLSDKSRFMTGSVLDVNGGLIQKEFCKHLESLDKFEGASIVNFGSIMGKHGFPRFSCYAATKAAIEAFTTSTAKELGKKNIRVNCIRPGLIDTPMTNHAEEKDRQMTIMMTPLQRIGQPEDIADVAAFLLSDKSRFMTGSVLDVNGGLSM